MSARYLTQTAKVAAILLMFLTLSLSSHQAQALFLDGGGHYSLRGETQTSPGFRSDTGTYQAIEQNFLLNGEARLNDRSSVFLEFRLFDDPNAAYLGDKPQPADCPTRRRVVGRETTTDASGNTTVKNVYSEEKDCSGRFQNSGEPGYQPYTPKVTHAYVRYAFDYCLLEAGRRPRDWGLGIFLDSGKGPFSTTSSTFDGIDCNINIQKSQALGFRFGFDKLTESGTYVDNPYDRATPDAGSEREFDSRGTRFGATNASDDMDQFFLAIQYDDRKANAGAAFTKNIGLYFANATNKSSNTDLKFLDLYTGFYLNDLTFRNEILFRVGKSGDPNWTRFGGASRNDAGEPAVNNLQSIGLAGAVEYTFSRSGAVIGPAEFHQGNATRHMAVFEYAYAPGSDNGYYSGDSTGDALDETNRSDSASAMAFNRNFKPALILFNSKPGLENHGVDGVYDPSRVMNTTLLALAYRYESLENGNFEAKFITARLNKTIPGTIKDYYSVLPESGGTDRPVGTFGRTLGYELDLKYSYLVGKEVELGVAGGGVLPAAGIKTTHKGSAMTSFLLQTFATFKF